MNLIIGLILAGLTLLAISLQRTYGDVPEKELKRRARKGDQAAELLHRAVAYGASLRALLWILVVISASSFFVYISRNTAVWFGLFLSAMVVWFGFLWLPAQDATKASVWLASKAAPALAWILQYVHPIFSRSHSFIRRHRPIRVHTGIYDKEDLLQLFERQEVQADNRIEKNELEIAYHAMTFGNKKVGDILTPRRVVKAVSADDVVGPVLMSELHESGFSRFPVYEGEQDHMVGVLYLRDLVKAKTGGSIRKVMHDTVCFVHEDQSLHEALQAILKTHQQLFVVVNNFEEYVGIVTMEDVLEEIIGKQIIDEFDQYDDMRAVAAISASKDKQSHYHPSVDESEVEVVE